MLVMPEWWWKIAGETWLSLRGEEVPTLNSVWIFDGNEGRFAIGVFSTKEIAYEWILKERPKGVLTKYILDKPNDPDFPEHYHYEEEDDYNFCP